MAETIWEKGTLQQVWLPAGVESNGDARFIRAGFDILKWASTLAGDKDLYINTVGNEQLTDEALANVRAPDWQFRAEFGGYNPNPILLQPHEADGSDSIRGLHFIGPI